MSEQLAVGESRLPLRGRGMFGESIEHEEDTSKSSLGLFCTCGSKFQSEYTLSLHIRKLTKAEGKYKCEICDGQFFVERILHEHLQLEHKPKNGKGCIDCGKKIPTGEFFRKHCELAHPPGAKSPPPATRPAPPSLEQDDSNDSIQFIGIFTAKQADTSKQESEPPVQPQASTSSAALATPIIIKTSMMTRSQVKEEPPPSPLENLGFTFPSPTPDQLFELNSSRTKFPRIFGCVICQNGFTRVYDLQRHLKNVHDAEFNHLPIACLHCEKTFRTSKDCISHCATLHPPIDLKPKLPLASSSRDSIPVPILTIDEEDEEEDYEYSLDSPPLSPSESIVIYETAPSLQDSSSEDMINSPLDTFVDPHQQDTTKIADGVKEFFCTCGKKYFYKKCLENHILSFSHLEETQGKQFDFECDVCRQIFPTESQLKDHTKGSHKMLIVESMEDGGERRYAGCVHCKLIFDTYAELQRHQELEHDPKVRKVRQVARPNVRRAVRRNSRDAPRSRPRSRIGTTNLIEGNSAHHQVMDENEFVCSCGKVYKWKRSLRRHIDVQARGYIFKCLHCQKDFSSKFNLKVHTNSIHKVDF